MVSKMANYGMVKDIKEKSKDGNYVLGLYRVKPEGQDSVDIRDYKPADWHITHIQILMRDRVRFRCDDCNKLIYIDDWNNANPSWPNNEGAVCDECFHMNYLGQTFDV